MNKKWLKISSIACLLIMVNIGVLITFSPFKSQEGFDYPLIQHTIEIEASVEETFNYLGNSDNAKEWSVFVDHINPLNANEVLDGDVGSERRCFVKSNEKGTQWDERITEVIDNQKRQLTIYNLQGFPLTANNLATEQIYKRLSNGHCLLTFTLFYKDEIPTFGKKMKTHIAAYRIKTIFKANMKNIKRLVEGSYY